MTKRFLGEEMIFQGRGRLLGMPQIPARATIEQDLPNIDMSYLVKFLRI